MTAGRKSSINRTDWNTPKKYVDVVLEMFGHIDLDPCSNHDSIVPAKNKFIYPFQDGLLESWNDYNKIYVNPPYGKGYNNTTIKDWLRKCHLGEHDQEILCLIPVATNTSHWKEFVFPKATICFLNDTRLKFRINGNENNKGIPVACAMIYYGNNIDKFINVFSKYGNCVRKIT